MKFSEYTIIPEVDKPVFHPNTGGNFGGLRPSIGGNIAHVPSPSHKNTFSSVSSQMTCSRVTAGAPAILPAITGVKIWISSQTY